MNTTSGPKIAVCISGETRTALEASPAFRFFFNECKPDIFYHTWHISSEMSDALKSAYSPKKASVSLPLKILHYRPFASMLYSFMMANELKKQYEIENNFRYDIVIRYRFDLLFRPNVQFNALKVKPRTIYYTNENQGFNNVDYDHHGINDVMFWGDSASMDIISDVYRYFKFRCEPNMKNLENGAIFDPKDYFFSPGVMIYNHGIKRNLLFEKVNDLYEILFREQVKHLNPIRNYESINRYYRTGKL